MVWGARVSFGSGPFQGTSGVPVMCCRALQAPSTGTGRCTGFPAVDFCPATSFRACCNVASVCQICLCHFLPSLKMNVQDGPDLSDGGKEEAPGFSLSQTNCLLKSCLPL